MAAILNKAVKSHLSGADLPTENDPSGLSLQHRSSLVLLGPGASFECSFSPLDIQKALESGVHSTRVMPEIVPAVAAQPAEAQRSADGHRQGIPFETVLQLL